MKDHTGSAEQVETRKLAAIMFTDIVGFSRQMGADETRTLRLLDLHNQILQRAVTDSRYNEPAVLERSSSILRKAGLR